MEHSIIGPPLFVSPPAAFHLISSSFTDASLDRPASLYRIAAYMINSIEDVQLQGSVEAIFISKQKGLPREKTGSGRFLESHGLEGDIHSGPGNRQVPLYCHAGQERLASGDADGLCFARFQETVSLRGIDTRLLKRGGRLESGRVILEVSEARKKCYPECPITKRGKRCDLADSVRFCRVISGGMLSVGDLVQVTPLG